MNEFICLQLLPWISINSSPVTVQTQDPWLTGTIQFFAVLFGALTAGYISYRLQKQSFDKQDQRDQMNRREAAYMELIRTMADYRLAHTEWSVLVFHLYKAFRYGSPNVRAKIQTIINRKEPPSIETLTKDLEYIDEAIYHEFDK